MYRLFVKRLLDIVFSFLALVIVLPLFLVLTITGAIQMKGNPFFIQERPGLNEKIFKLIKFRTMSNAMDLNGKPMPDEARLVPYGRFLRKTSLDELPELLNILWGDMSIVGPRPLLVQYLLLYSDEQRHRHDVRPGLTGLAQINGRNSITWNKKFQYDLEYVKNITFFNDLKIIFFTMKAVLVQDGISSNTSETMEDFTGEN